jgi:DNA-binding MarR family transcriptional regulator
MLEFQAEHQYLKGYLRPAAFTIARILFFDPAHRRTLTDLAREIGVSVTYVTRLSHELQRDGWVERVRDRTDRRVTFVQLTPAGESRCREALLYIVRMMERATGYLTDAEKNTFQELLQKFARGYIASLSETPAQE